MDTAVAHPQKMYDEVDLEAFERQPQKRCNSFPAIERQSWVPEEKGYSPGETLLRSISLMCKTKDRCRLAAKLKLETAAQGIMTGTRTDDDDYDSDEDDRNNNVPTTYIENQCRIFNESMKDEVEVEFQRLKIYSLELQEELYTQERDYLVLRRLFFEKFGLDWTSGRWERFLLLEEAVSKLRDKVCAVEEKMCLLYAQMLSFLEYKQFVDNGGWQQEGDLNVWSLKGVAEERVIGFPSEMIHPISDTGSHGALEGGYVGQDGESGVPVKSTRVI
ncbi:hypothetical protein F5Y19DRAFT_484741 [Xylariaceae sp. FL1651]|nr:hypothetical protein F5Y19DRAFT_484741 [Xylariaceae sp. FL1651]